MDDDIIEIERLRTAVVIAGHTGDESFARSHLDHPNPDIRSAALGALERLGCLESATLSSGLTDGDSSVRRRAAQLAARHRDVDLIDRLDDADDLVVEMAAWACGEQWAPEDDGNRVVPVDTRIVLRLVDLATSHSEPLVRESAVAALGSIQDERGLDAILSACDDKPAIRRRAVLALAPFGGPDVDAALRRALDDRDWQVRQAAEDVLGPMASSRRGTLDDQQDSEQNEET